MVWRHSGEREAEGEPVEDVTVKLTERDRRVLPENFLQEETDAYGEAVLKATSRTDWTNLRSTR